MSLLSPSGESLAHTDVDDVPRRELAHVGCPAAGIVADWHDQNHAGAYVTCQEQPCNAIGRVCTP